MDTPDSIMTINSLKVKPALYMAIVLFGVGIITGCSTVSSPTPPNAELQAAQQAIAAADQIHAANYAPFQMTEAREKLAAAQSVVSREKMVTGQRLADESRVDAELALAKTAEARAQSRATNNKTNNNMQRSNDMLKQPDQSNTGVQP